MWNPLTTKKTMKKTRLLKKRKVPRQKAPSTSQIAKARKLTNLCRKLWLKYRQRKSKALPMLQLWPRLRHHTKMVLKQKRRSLLKASRMQKLLKKTNLNGLGRLTTMVTLSLCWATFQHVLSKLASKLCFFTGATRTHTCSSTMASAIEKTDTIRLMCLLIWSLDLLVHQILSA